MRFGQSKAGIKDLIHVEEQIKELGIMPDFGYHCDNYLIEHSENTNKWRHLTGLIGDARKFEWLMSYVQLQHLQSMVQKNRE